MLKIFSALLVCLSLTSACSIMDDDDMMMHDADMMMQMQKAAQGMVADAIDYYDAHGADATFMKITEHPAPMFMMGDTYAFVISDGGMTVAHGADKDMVGTDVRMTESADQGKMLGDNLMMAATMDGAWFDYEWMNPVSHMVEKKSSWLVRHGGYVFGAGYYK